MMGSKDADRKALRNRQEWTGAHTDPGPGVRKR